jgi:hypothetical protein
MLGKGPEKVYQVIVLLAPQGSAAWSWLKLVELDGLGKARVLLFQAYGLVCRAIGTFDVGERKLMLRNG